MIQGRTFYTTAEGDGGAFPLALNPWCRRRGQLLETIPRNIVPERDIEFRDEILLLGIGHFLGGLLGFIPEELGWQAHGCGSCRPRHLMPHGGDGLWLFPCRQQSQFGDKGKIQPSGATIIEVLAKVIDSRSMRPRRVSLRDRSLQSPCSYLVQREPTFP